MLSENLLYLDLKAKLMNFVMMIYIYMSFDLHTLVVWVHKHKVYTYKNKLWDDNF